jgi:hypothetical protein
MGRAYPIDWCAAKQYSQIREQCSMQTENEAVLDLV